MSSNLQKGKGKKNYHSQILWIQKIQTELIKPKEEIVKEIVQPKPKVEDKIEIIQEEKKLGTKIFVETCPHYLTLSYEKQDGYLAK
ncbi:dihydropyrimidinase protein, partial [Marine Group I thaumarchaeote SCGC AAA799-E16]